MRVADQYTEISPTPCWVNPFGSYWQQGTAIAKNDAGWIMVDWGNNVKSAFNAEKVQWHPPETQQPKPVFNIGTSVYLVRARLSIEKDLVGQTAIVSAYRFESGNLEYQIKFQSGDILWVEVEQIWADKPYWDKESQLLSVGDRITPAHRPGSRMGTIEGFNPKNKKTPVLVRFDNEKAIGKWGDRALLKVMSTESTPSITVGQRVRIELHPVEAMKGRVGIVAEIDCGKGKPEAKITFEDGTCTWARTEFLKEAPEARETSDGEVEVGDRVYPPEGSEYFPFAGQKYFYGIIDWLDPSGRFATLTFNRQKCHDFWAVSDLQKCDRFLEGDRVQGWHEKDGVMLSGVVRGVGRTKLQIFPDEGQEHHTASRCFVDGEAKPIAFIAKDSAILVADVDPLIQDEPAPTHELEPKEVREVRANQDSLKKLAALTSSQLLTENKIKATTTWLDLELVILGYSSKGGKILDVRAVEVVDASAWNKPTYTYETLPKGSVGGFTNGYEGLRVKHRKRSLVLTSNEFRFVPRAIRTDRSSASNPTEESSTQAVILKQIESIRQSGPIAPTGAEWKRYQKKKTIGKGENARVVTYPTNGHYYTVWSKQAALRNADGILVKSIQVGTQDSEAYQDWQQRFDRRRQIYQLERQLAKIKN